MAVTTYEDLEVGDRVVCIDDEGAWSIKKGVTYTIRYKSHGMVYVDSRGASWYPKRFVKVSDNKSEVERAITNVEAAMASLKALLNK